MIDNNPYLTPKEVDDSFEHKTIFTTKYPYKKEKGILSFIAREFSIVGEGCLFAIVVFTYTQLLITISGGFGLDIKNLLRIIKDTGIF